MRIHRIGLSNFQSFRGEHELDLRGVDLAVFSGPNGSGKSTLAVDALRFALFGTARGGNLDTAVTEDEELGRVEAEFALDGHDYTVSRQRSRKGAGKTTVALLRDGEDIGGGIAETDALIREILHMDDDLWTTTVCANQGNASAFAAAAPAHRKQTLEDILQLQDWAPLAEAARTMEKEIIVRQSALEASLEQCERDAEKIPQIEAQLSEAHRELADLDTILHGILQDLDALAAEREQTVGNREAERAARKELTDVRSRLRAAAEAHAAADKRLDSLRSQIAERETAEQQVADAEAARARADELEVARQQRETLTADLDRWQERIRAADDKHAAEIERLDADVRHEVSSHTTRGLELGRQVKEREAQVAVLGEVPCTQAAEGEVLAAQCPLLAQAREAEAALPDLRAERDRVAADRPWADAEERLHRAQQARPSDDMRQQEGRVRTCLEHVAYDAAEHEAARNGAAQIDDARRLLARVEAAEAQWTEASRSEESLRSDLEGLRAREAELTAGLGEETDWEAKLAALDKRREEGLAQQQRVQRQAEIARAGEGSLTEQLRVARSAEAKAEKLRDEIGEVARRARLLHILGNPQDGAFSRAGIPALLIDQAIPELEEAANDVLATLSDGRLSLELRTQAETRRGKDVRETLDIVVFDGQAERRYETFSGGEGMRLDLALRAALATLLAGRAGARCETLILDETAAPLDEEGRAALVECLGRIADRFGLVLFVTHVAELKDAFPCRVEVTKDGGGSRFEVVR